MLKEDTTYRKLTAECGICGKIQQEEGELQTRGDKIYLDGLALPLRFPGWISLYRIKREELFRASLLKHEFSGVDPKISHSVKTTEVCSMECLKKWYEQYTTEIWNQLRGLENLVTKLSSLRLEEE